MTEGRHGSQTASNPTYTSSEPQRNRHPLIFWALDETDLTGNGDHRHVLSKDTSGASTRLTLSAEGARDQIRRPRRAPSAHGAPAPSGPTDGLGRGYGLFGRYGLGAGALSR
jgi:hypothetical protein